MADTIDTKVVQVSNIAPNATRDQMKTLFSYLGRINEIRMYPSEASELQVTAKVCYVKYDEYTSVGVALHLTNTVFIDRALIVIPVMDGEIPDEQSALQRASSTVAGMLPGQTTWPNNVISQLQSVGGSTVIITNDPRLTALGLPQYPPLPSNTDPGRIEEIRRTVYISNLDSSITGEVILSFFAQVGEIKYVRMGGDEMEGGRCAYVEFTDQRSIATALTYNGVMFHGRSLSVAHSSSAIEKPKTKIQEAVQREIEEAMKKVKEAQSLITAAADSGDLNIEKTVSKLASGLGRSRSKSQSRRHRTRSRSHRRSRSRHKSSKSRRRSRSSHRSRSRRKSRSRSRKRSRSVDVSKTAIGVTSSTATVGVTGLKKPGPGMPGGPGTGLRKAEYPGKPTGPGVGPTNHQLGAKSPRKRSRSRSRRRSRSARRKRSSSRSRKRRSSRSRSKRRSGSRSRRSRSRRRSHSRHKSRSPRKSRTPPRKSRTPPRKRSSSPPKLRREGSERLSSSSPVKVKSTDKRSTSRGRSRSRSPSKKIHKVRSRSRSKGRRNLKNHSPSRKNHSPSRKNHSPSRKNHSPSRKKHSPSRKNHSPLRKRSISRTRQRSRSRSGSKHRSRKDKKKEKEREHSKEWDKERDKKKKLKEKEKEEKKDNIIHRDYDEEEQNLYNDDDERGRGDYRKGEEYEEEEERDDVMSRDETVSSPEPIPTRITTGHVDTDLQQVDMDMSD